MRSRPPDFVQKFVARQHRPLILHKAFDQFEFERCQRLVVAAHADFMPRKIHRGSVKLVDVVTAGRGLLRGRSKRRVSREQIADPADQFRQFERLGQVLVGAQVEATHLVFGERAGTEDQHRRLFPRIPEFFQNRVAAHPRQHQIQDDQMEMAGLLTEQPERRGAVLNQRRLVPLGLAVKSQTNPNVPFVLDDQNAFGHDTSQVNGGRAPRS